MNKNNFQKTFQELAEILDNLQLKWVVDQVSEQVRLGKAVDKEVTAIEQVRFQEALPGLPPDREHKYKVIFSATAEYTAQERLLLLVDAIKHAVVYTAYMTHEFTHFFDKDKRRFQKVELHPNQIQEPVTFTTQSTASCRDHATHLKELLDALYLQITRDNLDTSSLDEIPGVLARAIGPGLELESVASNLFEIYIFSLIIQAAKAENASISYKDVRGKTPRTFEFLTSPGHIYSATHPYTYAVIKFPHKPVLEAHIGVRIAGKSHVLHRNNIALALQTEAETCRRNQVPPRSSEVTLVVVCKFHSTHVAPLQARSFMGLEMDLTARDCYFVVNTLSAPVVRLLDHHRKNWEHLIFPGSITAVIRLQNLFQTSFKNFKARY